MFQNASQRRSSTLSQHNSGDEGGAWSVPLFLWGALPDSRLARQTPRGTKSLAASPRPPPPSSRLSVPGKATPPPAHPARGLAQEFQPPCLAAHPCQRRVPLGIPLTRASLQPPLLGTTGDTHSHVGQGLVSMGKSALPNLLSPGPESSEPFPISSRDGESSKSGFLPFKRINSTMELALVWLHLYKSHRRSGKPLNYLHWLLRRQKCMCREVRSELWPCKLKEHFWQHLKKLTCIYPSLLTVFHSNIYIHICMHILIHVCMCIFLEID